MPSRATATLYEADPNQIGRPRFYRVTIKTATTNQTKTERLVDRLCHASKRRKLWDGSVYFCHAIDVGNENMMQKTTTKPSKATKTPTINLNDLNLNDKPAQQPPLALPLLAHDVPSSKLKRKASMRRLHLDKKHALESVPKESVPTLIVRHPTLILRHPHAQVFAPAIPPTTTMRTDRQAKQLLALLGSQRGCQLGVNKMLDLAPLSLMAVRTVDKMIESPDFKTLYANANAESTNSTLSSTKATKEAKEAEVASMATVLLKSAALPEHALLQELEWELLNDTHALLPPPALLSRAASLSPPSSPIHLSLSPSSSSLASTRSPLLSPMAMTRSISISISPRATLPSLIIDPPNCLSGQSYSSSSPSPASPTTPKTPLLTPLLTAVPSGADKQKISPFFL